MNHHTPNIAAVLIPFSAWLAHAPEFFTATAGACGTLWYIVLFYEKWRRRKHKD